MQSSPRGFGTSRVRTWLSGRLGQVTRRLHAETRGFLGDSTKLGMGSAIVVASYAAQIALITHILGLSDYGIFAIVVSTVDLVARLLDFQVGQMTNAFAAESIDTQPGRTIGIAQFSYLVDGISGALGFLLVLALAPVAATYLVPGESWALFALYAVTILITTTEPTSIALLQLCGRFGTILRITVVREAMRFALVLAALLATHSIYGVIVALLFMELAVAFLWVYAADRAMRERVSEAGLLSLNLAETRPIRREMLKMVLNTNAISYVKVLAAQGPTLLLGAMRTPFDAGLFKIGTAVAAVAGKPADPAWAAVLPRLARLRVDGRTDEMRTLIRHTTLGAFILMTALGVVAVVFREPLLRLVGGEEAVAAGGVLVLSVLARVVNGTVFWNSPLLFAFKRSELASRIFLGASLVFVPVLVVGIDRWGATGAAGALLVWNIVVNAGLTVAALRAITVAASGTPPASMRPA
jgi:O-antigen/teichoic acid export membrane protein